MRSHLNRVVFRKLLASEPIAHRGCLCRRLAQNHASHTPASAPLPRAQRRYFFNIFRKPPRQTSEPRIAPGLEYMIEFAKRERLNARLPPPDKLADAVQAFMSHIKASKKNTPHLPDAHAQHVLRSLLYLRQQHSLSHFSHSLLRDWLDDFTAHTRSNSAPLQELATVIFQELCHAEPPTNDDVRLYANALCFTGASLTARNTVIHYIHHHKDSTPTNLLDEKLWINIIRGLSWEGNETELLHSLDLMKKFKVDFSEASVYSTFARFYVTQNNVEKAVEWYNRYKQLGATLDTRSHAFLQQKMLNMCLSASQFDLGQSIIKDITETTPSKFQWDLILGWAAATGKGADEIDRMMGVMERSNQKLPEHQRRSPDVITINRLVKIAVDRKDPYLAERFITLGKTRNIQPDVTTLIYQMEYRLAVKDVDGALSVYKHMMALDLSEDKDVPVVNELIRAMCTSGRQDFESIMNVAADLSDRHARFEPATVSALSVLHLSRDEIPDVIDLLNTHVYSYDTAERALVRDTLVDYTLRPSTTTAQAWDAYTIFRQVFDETPREQRIQVMDEFFRRERPDMAVHVFNHMRTHTRADTIPTIDTYVSCLGGIARLKDEESLEVVHNQLKLDYNIEPNTHLHNALMQVYTACGRPRAALAFWDEIASSREGPSIKSIHLALRACEDSPWGDEKARQIWTKLNRTGIELDQSLWASYAGALAGNGNVEGAINEMEDAHAQRGVDMDTFLIGTLYNAAPGFIKKGMVETWAKGRYPEIWTALEEIGTRTSEVTEMPEFCIDRNVDP